MPSRPRLSSALSAILAVCFCLLTLCLPVPVEAEPAAPYFQFAIDDSSVSAVRGRSGSLLSVLRDAHLPAGEPLTLNGWLATDKGVTGYRYLWVPSGGDYAAWQDVPAEHCAIGARQDLAAAQIPYPNGHATAGFALTIPTPDGLADGYYDIYIRAVDSAGAPCDFLSLLHLRYGNADADDGLSRVVNFDRLSVEAAADPAVLQNGAAVREDGLYLPSGASVRLGTFDLSGIENVEIEYYTASGEPLSTDDHPAVLGLKSSDRHPFVTEGQPGYDLTDTIAYTLPRAAEGTLTADLSTRADDGEVWLTGCFSEPIIITKISFVYNGNSSDRVAARIRLSETLLSHLGGTNAVNLSGVKDPVMGDVLRIEVAQDTNDPYVHFYAEQVLEAADIRLSADTYKYMVILARSMPHNHGRHMALYLCAGTITSATGDCTYSFLTENDGAWHYYLLDLTGVELWKGTIHGWRFDIINGNCLSGDAMDLASVQFFRTKEAAEAAAARPVSEATPYRIGDPVVDPDMVEEQNSTETLDPAETYILTEAVTEPVTEPMTETDIEVDSEPPVLPLETEPELETQHDPLPETPTEPLPATDTAHATESETAAEEIGCRSHLPLLSLLLPTAAVPLIGRARKKKRRS